MSISVMKKVQHLLLPSAQKTVATHLASHLWENHPEKGTYVGVDTLAHEASLGESTVHRALRELEGTDRPSGKPIVMVIGHRKGVQGNIPIRVVLPENGEADPFFEQENEEGETPAARVLETPAPRTETPAVGVSQGETPAPRVRNSRSGSRASSEQVLKTKRKKQGEKRKSPSSGRTPGGQEERDAMLVEIQRLAGRTVSGREVLAAAEAMLRKYEPTEIVKAFAEHVHDMDDFAMKRNIETFFTSDGGGWLVLLQRQKRAAEQKATQEQMARQEAEMQRQAHEESQRLRAEQEQADAELAAVLGEDDAVAAAGGAQ